MAGTVFDVLERDWVATATSRAARRAMSSWAERDRTLVVFGDPAALVAQLHRRRRYQHADRWLHHLLAAAGEGDDLAGRTVLQALLPGLRALAFELGWAGEHDDVAAAVVEACWSRIGRYPLRRRNRVAANLLWDTRQLFLRSSRRHGLQPWTTMPEPARVVEDPSPGEELLEVVRDAVQAGVITPTAGATIVLTRVGDVPVRTLARVQGCAPGTLLRRRHRAESLVAAAQLMP